MRHLNRAGKLLLIFSIGIPGAIVSHTLAQANPAVISQLQAQANPNTTNLVKHLNKIGAKMYGAYWCKFCKQQKEILGTAAKQVNYIECDPAGQNPQPALCQKAQIKGYPTWEINGKLYPGMLTLQQLAQLSGYKGPL
ncbi:hypothetical protein [Synechococcus sp. PCC 6312]|uniref:hypothetical protein n=1 Tax=Synechococcus sp. (strain ATCC 27167 / PCC 6312) TaxID=195253 RepID=UPI0002FBB101|nr:hypothetical protein [Synechococcus sp. PCC 6312]